MKAFATVLNCMDGRAQLQATEYFVDTFGVSYLDTITAPGMVKHIAHRTDRTQQILDDVRISIDKHGSTQIGLVAHGDCAGNPVQDQAQQQQVALAISEIQSESPQAEIVGIWLDVDNNTVERIEL